MNITKPLRLATGSHKAGSGKGCAMNVISWENGDTTITDLPECSDHVLARTVHRVNDTLCTHRDGDLLCAPCSVKVLFLAHRTVGTAGLLDRVGQVRLAVFSARKVAHLNTDPRVMAAIEAAERWIDEPTMRAYAADVADVADVGAVAAAANAANTAANTAANAANAAYNANTPDATHATHAAANAAAAATHAAYAAADATHATHAAAYAAYAYACACGVDACAADAANKRLAFEHELIDEFNRITNRTEAPVDPQVTKHAVSRMLIGG